MFWVSSGTIQSYILFILYLSLQLFVTFCFQSSSLSSWTLNDHSRKDEISRTSKPIPCQVSFYRTELEELYKKKYALQINIQLNYILVSFFYESLRKSLEKAANFLKESYGSLKGDCIEI